MPSWVGKAARFDNSIRPSIGLAIDEYPNQTFRVLGAQGLRQFLAKDLQESLKNLCPTIEKKLISEIKLGGGVVRIDKCQENNENSSIFVDKSNLSENQIRLNAILSSSFVVKPFVSGVKIGILIPSNKITFTVTNIVTKPTINLNFDIFFEIDLRQGSYLLGEPPIIISDAPVTSPTGSISSNNILQITAQFNTTLKNTALDLCSRVLLQMKQQLQKEFDSVIFNDSNSPIKGGYSKLESIAWSEDLSTIFFLFTGGAAKIPLVGKGAIYGSIWWDSTVTKKVKSCTDISVNVLVQAGFDTALVGDSLKIKVGILQKMSYRQVGTDSICDFSIVGLPENSNLFVTSLVSDGAFTEKITFSPFGLGPIKIPGGSCSIQFLSSIPEYLRTNSEICGETVSAANIKIQTAPPEPK